MTYRFFLKLILLFSISMLSALSYADSKTDSFTSEQKTEIGNIVHDYLIKNPQVLAEAYQALAKQANEQAQQQAKQAIAANPAELFQADSPVIGNAQGQVNLVEFYDYQCSHCRTMAPIINTLQKANPNIRIVFKQLPIFGPNSELAARAVLGAKAQGKFFELHNALINATKPLNKEVIVEIASNIGLDTKQLLADMKKDSVNKEIANNYKLANSLGITGVPYFIIAKTTDAKHATIDIDTTAILPGEISQELLQSTIKKLSK